ncbi:MAG: 2-C-methyl-D-erythritol 2,4-cyclodiphosphate synthase [Sphingobacteriia bacterium]|nr:2-C-methyl-D-erythritol 2,4-cyclodiphosphate synthase [Sphingobacteriia bacterium]
MLDLNAVLIVAGGIGTRFNNPLPKQYFKYNNKTILENTLEKFIKHSLIDKIYVVVNPNDNFIDQLNLSPKVAILKCGGETRQISTFNGLKAIKNDNIKKILIHDACRPFITHNLITNIIKELDFNEGILPVLDINDALKQVDKNLLLENLNRDNYKLAQTPQGFIFNKIYSAHQNILDQNNHDDAGIALLNNIKIKTIQGETSNIKITIKEDIKMHDIEYRTGNGFDVHEFQTGDHIFLGGLKIPHDKGIKAHSDGDVVLHAIIDALLGALGENDIGYFFPPSDPKWKNADSKTLLIKTLEILGDKNFTISNIDVTIIGEEPKISPYRNEIRKCIANILNIEFERINVKAKTTEKLGFLGRKEGIACLATCNIKIFGKNYG